MMVTYLYENESGFLEPDVVFFSFTAQNFLFNLKKGHSQLQLKMSMPSVSYV